MINDQIKWVTEDPDSYEGLSYDSIVAAAGLRDQDQIDSWMAGYYDQMQIRM